jgi:hypothetical protein
VRGRLSLENALETSVAPTGRSLWPFEGRPATHGRLTKAASAEPNHVEIHSDPAIIDVVEIRRRYKALHTRELSCPLCPKDPPGVQYSEDASTSERPFNVALNRVLSCVALR